MIVTTGHDFAPREAERYESCPTHAGALSRMDYDSAVSVAVDCRHCQVQVACDWYGACRHVAIGHARGPLGAGRMGPIPVCARCSEKHDLTPEPFKKATS